MAKINCPNLTTTGPAMPHLPDGALAVTPSDADTFAAPVTIYVGGAGSVVASPANGNADVTVVATAGSTLPFRVLAVKATGTTATSMVAVY